MKQFTAKTFNIPTLKGISAKTSEEHLKLYAGYVKNAGLIDGSDRRFSFEFNGMRNHELYFSSLEGGAHALADSSTLKKAIEKDFGSFEEWLVSFKNLAMTRGIGWAMLWYDRKDNCLLASWVDEHHLGILNDCTPILTIDMFEHAFVADYLPSGKKQYVEDFFTNLNWDVIEKNFADAQ